MCNPRLHLVTRAFAINDTIHWQSPVVSILRDRRIEAVQPLDEWLEKTESFLVRQFAGLQEHLHGLSSRDDPH